MSDQTYRILKIQNELSFELGKTTHLMDALQLCIQAAMEATGMELGGIYLINNQGGLEMLCHRGLSEEFVQATRYFDRDTDRVRFIMQGNPIYFGDGRTPLPRTVSPDGAEFYRALAVVPFKHKDTVIGCFNIGTTARSEISEIDSQTLETIGSRIGDILARIRTEEQLRDSEEKLRVLCGSAANAVILMDHEGKISFWNASAQRIFGYTEEQALGKNLHSLLAPESYGKAHVQAFETFQKTGGGNFVGRTVEIVAVRKNGQEFPAELTMSAMFLKGKWSSSGIIRDLTRLKAAENEKSILQQQLQQAQKMEAIGTLAGGIAHDFNNILAAINGTAEMLLRSTLPDSPNYSKLQRIIKSGMRARDLSMKLLTFARKEKLSARSLPLNVLIADLADLLKGTISQGIRISIKASEDMVHVHVDANQILQALLNICLNACESMPGGGVLEIETRGVTVDAEQHHETRMAPGRYGVICISDSGAGMDADLLTKIFDPFFTTKEPGKGTGLGLSITHGIIHEHKGAVRVQSEPGKGSVFTIYLPASAPDAEISENHTPRETGIKGKGSILIIDDDQDFLQMIAEAVDSEGFDVTVALSGKQALDIYSNPGNTFDAVILDMILPEMDGTAIFHALKRINPEAKIILCSGFSHEGKATRLLNQGATAYIQKPFSISEMLDALIKC